MQGCTYAAIQVSRSIAGMQGDMEIRIEGVRAPGGWKDAGIHEHRDRGRLGYSTPGSRNRCPVPAGLNTHLYLSGRRHRNKGVQASRPTGMQRNKEREGQRDQSGRNLLKSARLLGDSGENLVKHVTKLAGTCEESGKETRERLAVIS